ncbi:hypothetical protein EMIT0111MI5_10088 [Burkholderia sp. IT-111MI5]|nr:hypothetical protein BVI1335_320096 [Burkholderia vietnamiensis]CAG9225585.1 hypothetical protein BVI2075_960013 [Burkholderia vietnamiensis]
MIARNIEACFAKFRRNGYTPHVQAWPFPFRFIVRPPEIGDLIPGIALSNGDRIWYCGPYIGQDLIGLANALQAIQAMVTSHPDQPAPDLIFGPEVASNVGKDA